MSKSDYGVLFLDIDGVWCTDRAIYAYEADKIKEVFSAWDPISMKLTDRLCKDFNLKVVVSSTWRQHENRDVWIISRTHGFTAEFHEDWKTPQLYFPGKIRGDEIEDWLKNHPEVKRYIILDDNSDMTPNQLKHHFVKTECYDGILFNHYLKAVELLKKQEDDGTTNGISDYVIDNECSDDFK